MSFLFSRFWLELRASLASAAALHADFSTYQFIITPRTMIVLSGERKGEKKT